MQQSIGLIEDIKRALILADVVENFRLRNSGITQTSDQTRHLAWFRLLIMCGTVNMLRHVV
ncbi:Uncharacterised protein [Vibrio cholerae]|nr:Uncharacterised protein [Vibrio cholerae]